MENENDTRDDTQTKEKSDFFSLEINQSTMNIAARIIGTDPSARKRKISHT